MPKSSGGALINYTIEETVVPTGYTAAYTTDGSGNKVITNTHTPEVVSVTATKAWLDGNNQDGLRPSVINAQLQANLVNVGSSVPLNAGNSWTAVWNNLPKYAAVGQLISYTVVETVVPTGYSVSYTTGANGVLNINDTHTPVTTSVTVNKVWADNNNQDGSAPGKRQRTAEGGRRGSRHTADPDRRRLDLYLEQPAQEQRWRTHHLYS